MTWQAGSDAAFCVGDRPLFAFWPLLQPFTKNVLLSPHSHVSDQTVSWSWLELEKALTPTAAQLSGVRKRLEAAVAAILDTIAEEPPASTQQILSVAASVLKGLAMKSDSALLAFCAATVSGVMVHSWSFRRAAVPSSLDSGEREIQGTVSVGGTATEGQEVVLEDIRGSVLARTRTDRDGSFIFGDLAPGRFRVRGVSDQIDFSVTGLVVDLAQGGVRGLQLKSTATRKPRSTKGKNPSADMVADDARADAAHSLPATTPGSRVDHQGRDHRWRGMIFLGLLTVIGGAGLFFWSNSRGRNGQDERDIGVEKGAWAEAEAQKTPVLPERMETQKMLEERRRQLAAGWRQTSSKG
ncbi:MAG TPA: carboxypeptidase-like regulatory domain-containing protein, partial [Opitutaceae bacterium]|nr:carboxypeptidase-like regulatory domain-containing protein [Opitutaceae bacterium]